MKRPPIDWIELGCRGWELDQSGAGLWDGSDRNHAHLDRVTLDLILGGSPAWVCRVLDDLVAANLIAYTPPMTLIANYPTWSVNQFTLPITTHAIIRWDQ